MGGCYRSFCIGQYINRNFLQPLSLLELSYVTSMIPSSPGSTAERGHSKVVQSHPLATSMIKGASPVLVNLICACFNSSFTTVPRSYTSWSNWITGYPEDESLSGPPEAPLSLLRSRTRLSSRWTGIEVGPSRISNSVRRLI